MQYYDIDGNKCTLIHLIKTEPEWAANTIQKHRELLLAMINAQHAGPITDEMYAAWDAARKYLEQETT